MRTTIHNNRGLTLIELLMTLAVLATTLAAATPSFASLMSATRARTSRSALTTALDTARMLAVGKSENVVVCPSADGQYCGHTTEWQHGWIVFVDADENGLRDDDEHLLAVGQALEGVAIVSTAGRTHLEYRPDGSAAGSNVTFTVCDRRGSTAASALVVNNAGRVRDGIASEAAASECEAVLDQPQA